MEVKIGVQHSGRELALESSQTQDEVEAAVTKALADGDGVLALTDDKGRRVLVPSARLAYVEIDPTSSRRVGFVTG